MKAPKSCILLVAALTVSGNARVWAGPQSLLDPYASIQAPGAKNKASKSKANKASKAEEKPEEKAEVKKSSTTRSALSSMEGEEERPVEKAVKPVKTEKKTHVAKERVEEKSDKPLATNSSDGGVVSGISDIKKSYVKTFKAAGSGIVNGTRAAGAKVAGGGKKVKDGFMNGAKAIGHGFKMPGSGKGKGTDSGENKKVAAAPHKPAHREKSPELDTSPPPEAERRPAPQVEEKVLDDASFPGKALEPLATKPVVKGAKSDSGENRLSRTMGKFKVFGRAKKQQANLPTARAASNPSQPFPN
jgi:hypothetical protein